MRHKQAGLVRRNLDEIVTVLSAMVILAAMGWLMTHSAMTTPMGNTVAVLVICVVPVALSSYLGRDGGGDDGR